MGDQGPEADTKLMDPDIAIVQDVEEDLEDYSRLVKLGRFGEASVFFREVLHRSLNHFAVLAEHCNALIEQGDFLNAELILSHSIGRQLRSARGSDRFEPDELQLLQLLLAYVSIYKGLNSEQEEEEALIQARWSRTLVDVSSPSNVTDVQRQLLLTCLRIHMKVDSNLVLEELRLPWSSKPSFPGETMTISDDYLSWFEILLAQHPWDANIILQHLDKLRPPSFVEAATKYVHKALSRLDSIEDFAMDPEVNDFHLALELLYRYYIFTPERDLRSVVLDKIAQFTAHFGDIPEARSMQMAIAYGRRLVPHGRAQKGFINQILQIRYIVRDEMSSKDRSAFENILYSIGQRNPLSRPSSKTLGYEMRPPSSPLIEDRAPGRRDSESSGDDLVVPIPTKLSSASATARFSDEKSGFDSTSSHDYMPPPPHS
ncbi:hypothetical protein KCU91_g1427, partial [Aureobasidium melanogenum]